MFHPNPKYSFFPRLQKLVGFAFLQSLICIFINMYNTRNINWAKPSGNVAYNCRMQLWECRKNVLMTLNRVKLVIFMKYLASVSTKNFDLELNQVSAIKFTESSWADGKWAYEEYLQKIYQYSFFYPIYHCLL